MKYIVYDWMGNRQVILFDPHHSHLNIAFNLALTPEQVLSAGMMSFERGRIIVSGESTTLEKQPNFEEDATLIWKALVGEPL
jgi:hypothetical protein